MNLNPINLGAPVLEDLPTEFLVSTWNVWFDRYQREQRNAALLAELQAQRPHIMLFQEVTLPFVRALQQADWLREGYWISGVEHNQIGVVMVARVRCLNLAFHTLTSSMGRRLLVAEFGGGVAVASGHFESNRSSGPVRKTQYTETLQRLSGFPAAVLGGDFNSSPQDPESEAFASGRDVWPELMAADPGYTVDSEGNLMLAKQEPNKQTRARIDRLFCLGGVQAAEIQMLGTQPFFEGDFPSDHFGLLARIRRS
ncbi:MAG: endonuclease/exonuclease/phosphatase family protein [Vulcanimicrobiota bacterium]